MNQFEQAAVIGGGVIGGGWVARLLLMGVDVNIYDTDPEAPRKIEAVLENAKQSLPSLYDYRLPAEGELRFTDSLAEAVITAQWICECVPERLELKHQVYKDIQSYCPDSAIIASSTSGFRPSQLQEGSIRPEQIIVAHPFNPVYLIPLVELVGEQQCIDTASDYLTKLGFMPIVIRKEIDAHIGDRLLEAVWREGLWLINDGIATTQEIDDVIRYGFGLRWAQMGLFETYRIAGGEAGMAHFLEQFGPALKWPWTKLMDVPDLDQALIDKIAMQSNAQSGDYSIKQLERIRDNNLVAMMRALKRENWGAGELINRYDAQLAPDLSVDLQGASESLECGLVQTADRVVPNDWTDYNGHMNDSRYAEAFSIAGDELLKSTGADADYVEGGFSYFTVDTRLIYRQECHAGDNIRIYSRIALLEGKKVRLEHQMLNANDDILALCDQLLLHVSLKTRRSCDPQGHHARELSKLASSHAGIPSLLN